MATIGIRELRQHASAYLRRVKAGETITVTDRGEPVARLVPIPKDESVLDRLVREGRATPAKGNLAELPPPRPPKAGVALPSQILRQMREHQH